MAVSPNKADEYVLRHNAIWPELTLTLKQHGVHNYSIFYHASTRQLFAYVEIEDENLWDRISQTEVCRNWWRYMSDIMPSREDGSPVSATLKEVFHMD